MLRVSAVLLVVASMLPAGELRAWRVSTAAIAAGQAADIATSTRAYEANPLLRASDGRLALPRAIALKGSLTAGVAIAQWIVLRRHPRSRWVKVFTAVNAGLAGVHFSVAARNARCVRIGTKF